VVNYSISLGIGFTGTVQVHVNSGDKTPEDLLKGYQGALYMGKSTYISNGELKELIYTQELDCPDSACSST